MGNNYYGCWTGGSGAAYHGLIHITTATSYELKVGKGGTGRGGAYNTYAYGDAGVASTLKLGGTTVITANGGGAGGWGYAGAGGAISTSLTNYEVESYSKKKGNNGTGGLLWTSANSTAGPLSGHTWGDAGSASSFTGGGLVGASHHGYGLIKLICPDPIFSSNAAGTYTIQLPLDGVYEIIISGAGAGSHGGGTTSGTNKAWCNTGGSGAGWAGTVRLTKQKLTLVVGAASTGNENANASSVKLANGTTIITAGGGLAGWSRNTGKTGDGEGGAGGTLTLNLTAVSTQISANGNKGNAAGRRGSGTVSAAGAASVLASLGLNWGASTDITAGHGDYEPGKNYAGQNGGIKINFKSK